MLNKLYIKYDAECELSIFLKFFTPLASL